MSKKEEIRQTHTDHPEDSAWMLAAKTDSSIPEVYRALDADDEGEDS